MRAVFSKNIAFVSKPRCGSTSVRLMLDRMMDEEAGDIRVDVAGEHEILHPHVTGPFLRNFIRTADVPDVEMNYFTVIRNPVSMLWSYYKYFQPDAWSRYNFSPNWDSEDLMEFEKWVCEGRIGANPAWLSLAPIWINTEDLSILSLEFYGCDSDGSFMLDRLFRIEEGEELRAWLSEVGGMETELIHTNKSIEETLPTIGENVLDKVRRTFRLESAMYGV